MRLRRYAPSDSSTYFKYASGVLGRKPFIHIRLRLLAKNPCEKCGLRSFLRYLSDIPKSTKLIWNRTCIREIGKGNSIKYEINGTLLLTYTLLGCPRRQLFVPAVAVWLSNDGMRQGE